MPDRKVTPRSGWRRLSAIVCADADLDWATKRIVAGGYGYAGPDLYLDQHVLVDNSIYEETKSRLIALTESCPKRRSNAWRTSTVCGPMISLGRLDGTDRAMDEAVAKEQSI